jgi:Cation efflux family
MGRPIFCTVPAVRRRRLADPRRALGHLAPDLSRWLVLAQPEPAAPLTMIAVAAIGALINGATALLFISGRKQDLNIRGAFLHMASDALVTLGVVLAGIPILWAGWLWVDPAISLIIGAVIVIGTWSLAAGIAAPIGNHTFRASGITAYLANGGALEHAQEMAAHESPRTTKLYDRTKERLTQDEVERIRL